MQGGGSGVWPTAQAPSEAQGGGWAPQGATGRGWSRNSEDEFPSYKTKMRTKCLDYTQEKTWVGGPQEGHVSFGPGLKSKASQTLSSTGNF